MKTTLLKGLMAAAPVLLALQSCSDDPISNRSDLSTNEIQFTASVVNAEKIYSRSDKDKLRYSKVLVSPLNNGSKDFNYFMTEVEDQYYNNPLVRTMPDATSRGTEVTNSNFLGDDNTLTKYISVCSYLYKGTSFYDNDATDKEQYIGNLNLSCKDGTSDTKQLQSDVQHYWPKAENEEERKMEFFAIYPSPDEYQPSDSDKDDKFAWDYTDEEGPKISTKVETDVENQKDYLFAEESVSIGSNVTLNLKHMMTAVTVELASSLESKYHIVSVAFSNIVKSATYDPKTNKWKPKSRGTCVADFEDPFETSLSHVDYGNTVTNMRKLGEEFFMIPQEFDKSKSDEDTWKNPVLTITVYDGDQKEEKDIIVNMSDDDNIKNAPWTAGQRVNYVVNDQEVDVTYEIWPEPMSKQPGTKYDSETGVLNADYNPTNPVDLNNNGTYDVGDNYVMFYSHDGSPAGDGDEYKFTDENGNQKSISDYGYMRVHSIKYIAGAKTQGSVDVPFKIEEDNDDSETEYVDMSKTTAAITIPSGDYNPYGCQYRMKVYMTANNTPVEDEESDETKIKRNTTFIENTSNSSTTGQSKATTYIKYVDLSRYKPYPDDNGNLQRWTDANGNPTEYAANCYIVNYPGYYKIPVVLGVGGDYNNAADLDAINLGTSGDEDPLGICVDYQDDNLSGTVNGYNRNCTGWIQYYNGKGYTIGYDNFYPAADGGTSKTDTYILWQDEPGVIEVESSTEKVIPTSKGDRYYINFTVKSGSIKPCNAVICVKNTDGDILWSYHIWVTPYNPYKNADDTFIAATNPQMDTYYPTAKSTVTSISTYDAYDKASMAQAKFLSYPIGFIQDGVKRYPERSTKIKLVQEESGMIATQRVWLVHREHKIRNMSCVYYQWGRKDPFPGANITESNHMNIDGSYTQTITARPIYGSQIQKVRGEYTKDDVVQYTSAYTIGYGIKHPNTFVYGHRFPTNKSYWDLWGNHYNDKSNSDTQYFVYPKEGGTTSKKTIYDPCPIGFKVPPIYAFPAITGNGKNFSSTYSPLIEAQNSESKIYAKIANTPYKSHEDFNGNGYFEFYTNRMTDVDTDGNGTKPSGKTFKIYPMGGMSVTDGSFNNQGKQGCYWSATRWCSYAGNNVFNQRMYWFQAGYSGYGSTFGAAMANTESFGYPVLPMWGN